MNTFKAYLVDAAAGQRRKHRFVLAPFVSKRALPAGVGFDAIAVANMHRRCTGQAILSALQRLHPPISRILHVDIEGGLIKLDDIHTICL